MLIVSNCIFGNSLASMQQHCEAKKKEDEAFQLCLPGRPSPHASAGLVTVFNSVRLAGPSVQDSKTAKIPVRSEQPY